VRRSMIGKAERGTATTCTYLAIALGVFTLMMWAVDVVPWCRDAHYAWCQRMTFCTLVLASLSAAFRGIARAKHPPQKTARWKRIAVRVAFWLLIPLGVIAFSEGHVCHVKAKQLEAQQVEILARTGYYHNPYRDRQHVCDALGYACFGGWILWTWFALVAQASESVASWVWDRKANVAGSVGFPVWTIVKDVLALFGLGMILFGLGMIFFSCWWPRGFT